MSHCKVLCLHISTARSFFAQLRALAVASSLVVLFATPSLATPLISEVFYDAVGSDDGKSFVELTGAPGTSLEGLVLQGVNGAGGDVTVTIALSGAIGSDGIFVLADVTGSGVTAILGADLVANFDFQNGPDSVVLRGPLGVLDAVGYGVFDGGLVFAGEGLPAPDGPAGSSLARRFADIDTNDNLLDFEVLASPTPGEVQLLPEPSSGVLALAGLGTIGWLGRRSRSPKR